MFQALLSLGTDLLHIENREASSLPVDGSNSTTSRPVVVEFDVLNGQFPSETEREIYDAFIITGSLASAYDDHPWTHPLMEYIKVLYAEKRRVLGICFGHQIIARTMGGKVVKSESGRQKGVRTCALTEKGKSFFRTQAQDAVSFIYDHGDEVVDVPAQASSIGGNDTIKVHGMIFEEGNMVTLQGHPEFSTEPGERCLQAIADYCDAQADDDWVGSDRYFNHLKTTPTDKEVVIKAVTKFLLKV
mmetsp:Transcript_7753/g.10143  ORF Transcript_7753/g.10143 Transcript_7753/m.10143 type:complete len:245 (-) Transcript_7753:746-1480(-)